MAFPRRFRRRLGRLLSPGSWEAGLAALAGTLALAGYRESTPLDRLAAPWERERGRRPGPLNHEELSVLRWVAGLPLFPYPLFPRSCLRRALAVYRHLLRRGLDGEVWVGLRREAGELKGHAWVELAGEVLGERREAVAGFKPLVVLRGGRVEPAPGAEA